MSGLRTLHRHLNLRRLENNITITDMRLVAGELNRLVQVLCCQFQIRQV
jgi:hypothetical protein